MDSLLQLERLASENLIYIELEEILGHKIDRDFVAYWLADNTGVLKAMIYTDNKKNQVIGIKRKENGIYFQKVYSLNSRMKAVTR